MAHVYVETTSKKKQLSSGVVKLNAVNYIEEFILPVIFLKKKKNYHLHFKYEITSM